MRIYKHNILKDEKKLCGTYQTRNLCTLGIGLFCNSFVLYWLKYLYSHWCTSSCVCTHVTFFVAYLHMYPSMWALTEACLTQRLIYSFYHIFSALCEFVVFKYVLRKVILFGENKTCDMSIVKIVLVIPQLFRKSKEINMHYCTEVSYTEKKSFYMYPSLFLKTDLHWT